MAQFRSGASCDSDRPFFLGLNHSRLPVATYTAIEMVLIIRVCAFCAFTQISMLLVTTKLKGSRIDDHGKVITVLCAHVDPGAE